MKVFNLNSPIAVQNFKAWAIKMVAEKKRIKCEDLEPKSLGQNAYRSCGTGSYYQQKQQKQMTAQELIKIFLVPYKAQHGINTYNTDAKLKKAGVPVSRPIFWAILSDKPYAVHEKTRLKLYPFFQIPFKIVDGYSAVDADFLEQLELEQQAKND